MNMNTHGRKVVSKVQPTTVATAMNTNPNRIGLIIRNNSTIVAYLGNDASVTALNGFPLKEDEIFIDEDSYDRTHGGVDNWYAITASGTGDLRLIEYV